MNIHIQINGAHQPNYFLHHMSGLLSLTGLVMYDIEI